MRRIVFGLLLTLSAFDSALAAEIKQPRNKKRSKLKKPTTEEVSGQKSGSSSDTDSDSDSDSEKTRNSRAYRVKRGQNYSLLYTPLSDFFLRYGAQAQLVRGPSLQLGVFVLMGSEAKNEKYENGTFTRDGRGTGFSVHARYFFGNSFNVLAGLGYRAATLKMELQDQRLGAVQGDAKVQSITLPIFIGNQWTWPSGLTLGVDWIGAWVPISGETQGSVKADLSESDIDYLMTVLVNAGDRVSKKTTLTILMTSIGWAL